LNLKPIVSDIAADFAKPALAVFSGTIASRGVTASEWILITEDETFLKSVEHTNRTEPLRRFGRRLWTDQYSNLLGVLKLTARSR
jgi:hypothetical protein